MHTRLFVMLAALALMADAKTKLLEHLPLRWSPTSELRSGASSMLGSAEFQNALSGK